MSEVNPMSADNGPIDPRYRKQMTNILHALDEAFNGVDCPPGEKKVGFFLTTFNMGDENVGRFNYISNADKVDVRTMLANIVARIDTRLADEQATTQ